MIQIQILYLIRLNDKRAKEIKVELLREGNILIRDASNFIGLDDRYIRIAIKSHKERTSYKNI